MSGELVTDPHAEAVLEVLNGVLPAETKAWAAGTLPAVRPDSYVEVFVSRRLAGEMRACGSQGSTGWRIGARQVALLEANAYQLRVLTSEALEYARLLIDGVTSTGIQFETAEDIGPDDGWFSGLSTWTYQL